MGKFAPQSAQLFDDETQRRSNLLLRTLPLSLIPIFAAMALALVIRFFMGQSAMVLSSGRPPVEELLSGLTISVIFFIALIMLVRLGQPTISAIVFVSVWSLFTTFITLENGVTSYWPAMMLLPICAAGLLLDGVASIALALLATLLVSVFSILEFNGMVVGTHAFPPANTQFQALFASSFWVAIFWSIAALTWMLARGLKRALQQTRAQTCELQALSGQLEQRVAAQTAELERRAERAEVLYQVSRALTNTLDLARVIDLIVAHAVRLLRFDAGLVVLVGADDDMLTVVGRHNIQGCPGEISAARARDLRTLCVGQHPVVQTLHEADGVAIEAFIQPMCHGTNITGALILLTRSGSASRSADDAALAEGLADQAAVAVAQEQLMLRLQETATLEERTRLAREIHDTLAQGLTGVVVQLGAAKQSLTDAPGDVSEHVELARRMARESLAEARRSVWNLRTPLLERGNLADALRGLAERSSSPATTIDFAQRGTAWALANPVESALLRVAQESLANVAKHARATSVHVVLTFADDTVELAISDDGVGIDSAYSADVPSANGPWAGFGLIGMRERLAALSGRLLVTGGRGTCVRAIVPRGVALNLAPDFAHSDIGNALHASR